jgi:hypothetical protein
MSDELKSAWQLAMEKLEAQNAEPPGVLSEEQKAEIADIRRKYKAKIAEEEISSESRLRKVIEAGAFEDAEKVREGLISEKARLNREMEAEVAKVRERR